MTGMDWGGLMRAGLYGLRLRPVDFWRLTPAELAVMLGVSDAGGPMRRGTFETLMAAFPDRVTKGESDG